MEFILPFALAAADGGLLRLMASLSCSWFSDGNGIKKSACGRDFPERFMKNFFLI